MISFAFGVAVWGAIFILLGIIVFGSLWLLGELLMGILAGLFSLFSGDD